MTRILIIEDDPDIRAMVRDILEEESYLCTEASCLDDAYEALHASFDAAIVDVWLGQGVQDGLLVLQHMKTHHPLIPVLMMSGHSTLDIAVQALKHGAFDFLEKPFDTQRLQQVVRRMVQKKDDALPSKSRPYLVPPSLAHSAFYTKAQHSRPIRLWLMGPRGTGKKALAQYLAQHHYPLDCIPIIPADHTMPRAQSPEKALIFSHVTADFLTQNAPFFSDISPNTGLIFTSEVMTPPPFFTGEIYHFTPLKDRPEDQLFYWNTLTQNWPLKPCAQKCFLHHPWGANEAEFFPTVRLARLEGTYPEPLSYQDLPLTLTLAWLGHADLLNLPLKKARDTFEYLYLTAQKQATHSVQDWSTAVGMDRTALYRKYKDLQDRL